MKYIITETQYKTIVESNNRIEAFQELIDSKLKIIREECDGGADTYEGNSSTETCKQLEYISKIKVTNTELMSVKHSNKETEEKYISVEIMIYFSSILHKGEFYADDLIYDLRQMILKSTGLPINIQYETINLISDPQW
jgi:hypothetical protein